MRYIALSQHFFIIVTLSILFLAYQSFVCVVECLTFIFQGLPDNPDLSFELIKVSKVVRVEESSVFPQNYFVPRFTGKSLLFLNCNFDLDEAFSPKLEHQAHSSQVKSEMET